MILALWFQKCPSLWEATSWNWNRIFVIDINRVKCLLANLDVVGTTHQRHCFSEINEIIKSSVTSTIFLTTSFSQRLSHNVFLQLLLHSFFFTIYFFMTSFPHRLSHNVFFHNVFLTMVFLQCLSYVFRTTSFFKRLSHNIFIATFFYYIFFATFFSQCLFHNVFFKRLSHNVVLKTSF